LFMEGGFGGFVFLGVLEKRGKERLFFFFFFSGVCVCVDLSAHVFS